MASYFPPDIDSNFKPFDSQLVEGCNAVGGAMMVVGDISNVGSEPVDEEPCIDINISNVVCTFNTRCHLNLKRVATEGMNVIYKREQGMVSMKLRHPGVTASIWSSGKITCTGAQSEEIAKVAARKVARCLQNIGFKVRFTNFRVVNVLGTCSLPFGIRINMFSRDNPGVASYEPELHPGATYRIKSPKACLKIFSTGSITVTAPSIANVQSAIEHIYPLVEVYKVDRPKGPLTTGNKLHGNAAALAAGNRRRGNAAQRHRPRNSGDQTDSDYTDDEDYDEDD